jgi:hypothetical protein
MVFSTATIGLNAQRGINLLQVGALRLPCLMASVGSVVRLAEISLRGVSSTLDFIGFKGESTFSRCVTRGVDYVRPYKNEGDHSTKKLLIEAAILATIGVIGNTFVSTLFGPPPGIYNQVLQWVGPIRVVADSHPLIEMLAKRVASIY